MEIKAIKTKVFHETEALLPFIENYVKKLSENSVLVITSKIVALSEGRTVEYKNAREKVKQKDALIRRESDLTIKTKVAWMTLKGGMVLANAGIDESNARGKLILLPKNSFQSAEILRKKLMKKFRLKNFGVLITDSGLMPMRAGALGIALGYAGFSGLRNYIGKKDIFDRVFKISKTNVADSLATAATVCMGEGNERQPLALITDAPIIFTQKIKKRELVINPEDDIYYPLLAKLS